MRMRILVYVLFLVAALLLLTGCRKGLRGENVPDKMKWEERR